MQRLSRRWLARVSIVLAALTGCSNPDRYKTVPVSGVVTCEGKPVANATINFSPLPDPSRPEEKPGRLALGITDNEGRFKLTTYVNDDGAIVGKHTVTISLNVDENTQRAPARFPCVNSSKEVEVTKRINDLAIDF